MSTGRLVLEILAMLPGIGAMLIALFLGHSESAIAQWCVQYWWTVMVCCIVAFGALRALFFLQDRGFLSS